LRSSDDSYSCDAVVADEFAPTSSLDFTQSRHSLPANGSCAEAPILETAMQLVPTQPSEIASFTYDETRRTLRACYTNGKVTICRDVPEAMFHVLAKTPTPEEFFVGYIALQYGCETMPQSEGRDIH
jgi:KTSC domain